MAIETGQTIGNYRLSSFIGGGAKGEVWRAERIDGGEPSVVAIKFLRDVLVQDEREAGRFRQEAKALLTMRHDNIACVFESGVQDGRLPYIVMEHVQGETLDQYIRRRGHLPIDEALSIAAQVADALDACHAKGILHRDVKSLNIRLADMADGTKRAVLLDFGIAKMTDVSLSMSGTIIGTPHYMSPEQASGEPMDHRTDQYSLAIVLWEMVTGKPPFDAPTPVAICYKHVHSPPGELDVPGANPLGAEFRLLEYALKQALSKKPEERFQSCRDFTTAAGGSRSLEAGVTGPDRKEDIVESEARESETQPTAREAEPHDACLLYTSPSPRD